MYGDVKKAGESSLKVIALIILINIDRFSNSEYQSLMKQLMMKLQ